MTNEKPELFSLSLSRQDISFLAAAASENLRKRDRAIIANLILHLLFNLIIVIFITTHQCGEIFAHLFIFLSIKHLFMLEIKNLPIVLKFLKHKLLIFFIFFCIKLHHWSLKDKFLFHQMK